MAVQQLLCEDLPPGLVQILLAVFLCNLTFVNHVISRTIYTANISNQSTRSLVSQQKRLSKFTTNQIERGKFNLFTGMHTLLKTIC